MYENSLHVNPGIRNFWVNLRKGDSEFHVFKKNRNLVYFGNDLSKSSYEFVKNRAEKLNINTDIAHQSSIFHSILEKEEGNEEILERLAKKAVFESFGIPEDIIKAELNGDDVDLNKTKNKEKIAYSNLDKETQKLINKRILLNCIIQGSSIHAFYTLHHLVKEDLEKIIPNIIPLYDSLSVGTVSSYWKIDYSRFVSDEAFSGNIAIGSSKVEYNDKNEPEVVCSAKTFVVLCQEMVKGGMECICLHGLQNIPSEQLELVYQFSDKRIDEPRYIQISSEIWRKLLNFYREYKKENEDTIPEYIMKISLLEPDNIENFFEGLFENEFDKCMKILSE
jgi:actin-related protein